MLQYFSDDLKNLVDGLMMQNPDDRFELEKVLEVRNVSFELNSLLRRGNDNQDLDWFQFDSGSSNACRQSTLTLRDCCQSFADCEAVALVMLVARNHQVLDKCV